MADTPMVQAARGLVAGVSLSIWAFATWLLPALVAAGWWRHRTHHVPLRYEPSLWSMVFPMGMYAVAASALSDADHLPLVGLVGDVGIWFAFAVWTLVFASMLTSIGRAVVGPLAGATVSRRSDPSSY
jgi:tellurite resistance protein TehA-like permease